MSIKNSKELYVLLLSNARQSTERSAKLNQEVVQQVQQQNVKEALEAQSYLAEKTLNTVDQCFKMLGEHPVKAPSRLQDVLIEDVRKDIAEIQAPEAKNLYILAKTNQLVHLSVAEYEALAAAAKMVDHPGVEMLVESCLANKRAMAEQVKKLIKSSAEGKASAKV